MQLHDFVLNLINDADARTAFELNPQACLDSAGLTDVTPADVHDAIPLVADYAPARVAGLTSGLPDLTAAALPRVGLGALQPVTTGLSNGDLSLAAAGGVTGLANVDDASTTVGTGGQLDGHAGPVDYSGSTGIGFDSSHDPAATLDHAVPGDLAPHTVDTVTNTLDSTHGLTGAVGHGVLDPGGLTSGLTSGVPGLDGHGLTGQLPGLDAHGLSGQLPGLDGHDLTGQLPGLDTLHGLTSTSGLLGDDPLHLGGGTGASGSVDTHTTGDGHLPDVTHLF